MYMTKLLNQTKKGAPNYAGRPAAPYKITDAQKQDSAERRAKQRKARAKKEG